jgi:hypothetical protein
MQAYVQNATASKHLLPRLFVVVDYRGWRRLAMMKGCLYIALVSLKGTMQRSDSPTRLLPEQLLRRGHNVAFVGAHRVYSAHKTAVRA